MVTIAAKKIRDENPGRVPVICEANDDAIVAGWKIGKSRYLAKGELSLGQFRRCLRKYTVKEDAGEEESCLKESKNSHYGKPKVNLYIDQAMLVDNSITMDELDNRRDEDGFLRLKYGLRFSRKSSSLPVAMDEQSALHPTLSAHSKESTESAQLDQEAFSAASEDLRSDPILDNEKLASTGSSSGQCADEMYMHPLDTPAPKDALSLPSTEDLSESPITIDPQGDSGIKRDESIETGRIRTAYDSVNNNSKESGITVSDCTHVKHDDDAQTIPSSSDEHLEVAFIASTYENRKQTSDSILPNVSYIEEGDESEAVVKEVGECVRNCAEAVAYAMTPKNLNVSSLHSAVDKEDYPPDNELKDSDQDGPSLAKDRPATVEDMDSFHKPKGFEEIGDSLQQQIVSESLFHAGDTSFQSGRFFPGDSPTATYENQSMDAIGFSTFESMTLSDDSGLRNNDESVSNSGGAKSTSGWPSLSHESSVDASGLSSFSASNLEDGAEICQAHGRVTNVKASEDNPTSSLLIDWVNLDDGTGEADHSFSTEATEASSRRSSFSRGKAYLINKISALKDLGGTQDSILNRAATLRNLAVNMMGGDIQEGSKPVGAQACESFEDSIEAESPSDTFTDDSNDSWTYVNREDVDLKQQPSCDSPFL